MDTSDFSLSKTDIDFANQSVQVSRALVKRTHHTFMHNQSGLNIRIGDGDFNTESRAFIQAVADFNNAVIVRNSIFKNYSDAKIGN